MKISSLVFVLSLIRAQDLSCDIRKPKKMCLKSCKEFDPKENSILIWTTEGRLGNQMYTVKNLLESRILHNMQVFMTRKMRNYLLNFFPNIGLSEENHGIQAAEDILCGFHEFYTELQWEINLYNYALMINFL